MVNTFDSIDELRKIRNNPNHIDEDYKDFLLIYQKKIGNMS